MLRGLADFLGGTWLSDWITYTPYMIQGLQTVHILGLAALIAGAVLLDLRLVGITRGTDSAAGLARRFLPPIWIGFLVLAATGILLVVSEPPLLFNRTLQAKLALIALALPLTLAIGAALREERPLAALARGRRALLALAGAISLLLWVLIGLAGRFIAYLG